MARFAILACFSPLGIRVLATRSACRLRDDLSAAATRLGGRLERMIFVSGTFSMTALVELPHGPGPALLIQSLRASGLVEAGAEIVRLLDVVEVEQAVAASRRTAV